LGDYGKIPNADLATYRGKRKITVSRTRILRVLIIMNVESLKMTMHLGIYFYEQDGIDMDV